MFKGKYAIVKLQVEGTVTERDVEKYLDRKGVKFISVEDEKNCFEVPEKDVWQLEYCIKKGEC